jgi:hypothetical protein
MLRIGEFLLIAHFITLPPGADAPYDLREHGDDRGE